ncbi:MAG: trimethylamine methyltransferase family protein [Chloroflexota bacterium]
MANTTKRRSRRSALKKKRDNLPILNFKFRQLRNPLPPTEFLNEEKLEQIHDASMRILEEIGIDFFDDEALSLWESVGAKVDHKNRHVWIERGLLLDLIAKAPASFNFLARNPKHNLFVGENSHCFMPMGGMVYASDMDRGRRPGVLADVIETFKVLQMCNMVHMVGGGPEMHDVDPTLRHLENTWISYTLSDKVVYGSSHGRIITQDTVEMAKIVFGDPLPDDPVIYGVVNVNSPLRYDDRMLGGMITLARAGQFSIITPFILAGAMSPITIASAIAQQNAEALAGIALTQIVNPGAPVVYGGFTTNIDMKTGSPAFGTPEGAWATYIGAQLARKYRLPYRGSGSLCSANYPDATAAYETMWSMWPTLMAHTNMVNHSAGWIENGLTMSYEKFIMDIESLAMFYHLFEGFEISDETLALDMMAHVGPGGHHLGTPHTQARYENEFFMPHMRSGQSFENWQKAGAEEAPLRANRIWKTLLKNYEQPELDTAVADALADFIARRKRELEGVDLYTD